MRECVRACLCVCVCVCVCVRERERERAREHLKLALLQCVVAVDISGVECFSIAVKLFCAWVDSTARERESARERERKRESV